MCTMSWILADDGYTVFFNRDEAKTRSLAEWPKIIQRNGVRLISPKDPDGGGTWMGVNEYGVSCCLLNNYDMSAGISNGKPTSRGLLVSALLEMQSQQEVLAALDRMPLSQFRPFWLAAFAPGYEVALAGWDGRKLKLTHEHIPFPITSSAVQSQQVVQMRLAALPEVIDEPSLLHYHSSHFDGNETCSVCTHRTFSETVSLSRVRVTAHKVEYFYIPGAPCRTSESVTVALHRTAILDDQRTSEALERLLKLSTPPDAFRRFPNR